MMTTLRSLGTTMSAVAALLMLATPSRAAQLVTQWLSNGGVLSAPGHQSDRLQVGGVIASGASTLGQINLYTSPPANYVGQAAAPIFSYYPIVGGNIGVDNTRASDYIAFTTVADAGYFESGLVVNAHLTTGKTSFWAPHTAYTAGQSVLAGSGYTAGAVYTAQNSGTSGPNAPTQASGIFNDGAGGSGGVTWLFRQVNAYLGKAGSSFFTVVDLNGSQSGPQNAWGIYENGQIAPGTNLQNFFAHEIDTRNNDVDCAIARKGCYALYIGGQPNKPMTAAISVNPQGTPTEYAYHVGVLMNGANVADLAGYDDETKASIGLSFNYLGVGASHGTATIQDKSASPTGYNDLGSHTTGINLGGTYSTFQIAGTGWGVDPTGAVTTKSVRLAVITVAALPACNSGAQGAEFAVSDLSAAPTYRQTGLTGGGTTYGHVECNGTAYEAH